MTWDRDEETEIIATPAQMKRFGITKNLDADRNDPRNAAYLAPLGNPQAEEFAKVWASAVWSAIADEHGGFASAEDDDWCYEQCLINGRKSECEPEYAAIFENMGSSPSHQSGKGLLQ